MALHEIAILKRSDGLAEEHPTMLCRLSSLLVVPRQRALWPHQPDEANIKMEEFIAEIQKMLYSLTAKLKARTQELKTEN